MLRLGDRPHLVRGVDVEVEAVLALPLEARLAVVGDLRTHEAWRAAVERAAPRRHRGRRLQRHQHVCVYSCSTSTAALST